MCQINCRQCISIGEVKFHTRQLVKILKFMMLHCHTDPYKMATAAAHTERRHCHPHVLKTISLLQADFVLYTVSQKKKQDTLLMSITS